MMPERYEDHDGIRYRRCQFVDVPVGRWVDGQLLPMDPVRYHHDGAGGVILAGGVIKRSPPLSEGFMQNRLAGLEEQRAKAAAQEYPTKRAEWFEDVLWSLVEAREQADRWRRMVTAG